MVKMASKERPKRQAAKKCADEFLPQQAQRLLADSDESWSPGERTLGGAKQQVISILSIFFIQAYLFDILSQKLLIKKIAKKM